MSSTQEEILEKTTNTIHQFQLRQELFHSLFYIVFILVVFYFFNIIYTVYNITFVIIISILYALGKEIYFHRRNQKRLKYQFAYLQDKSTDLILMIPILFRKSRKLALKSSAIVVESNQLFLEAFQQSMRVELPSESISVPYGDEFVVFQTEDDLKFPLIKYTGTLVGTDYEFVTVQHPAVKEMIQQFLKQERTNQDVNTTQ